MTTTMDIPVQPGKNPYRLSLSPMPLAQHLDLYPGAYFHSTAGIHSGSRRASSITTLSVSPQSSISSPGLPNIEGVESSPHNVNIDFDFTHCFINSFADQLGEKTTTIMAAYDGVKHGRYSFSDYFKECFVSNKYHYREYYLLERELRKLYEDLYGQVSVACRSELQQLISRNDANKKIMEAMQRLVAVERKWEDFLRRIDENLSKTELEAENNEVDAKTYLSNIALTACITGGEVKLADCLTTTALSYTLLAVMRCFGCPYSCHHAQQLAKHLSEFEQRSCDVILIVGTCCVKHGRSWLAKSGANSLQLLLDDKTQLADHFGLHSSTRAVLAAAGIDASIRGFKTYGTGTNSQIIDTRRDSNIYRQAGDILLDNRTGETVFVHRSKSIEDMLSIEDLLRQIPGAQCVPLEPNVIMRNGSLVLEDKLSIASHHKASIVSNKIEEAANRKSCLSGCIIS